MMLLGLTGGIGSGKSEALKAFERTGAATASADAIVHELLQTASVRDELVERWGPEVAPEGAIDRAVIAEKVFNRPEELRWLESVLHPRVGGRMAEWYQGLPVDTELAVVEVPLLFEAGMEGLFGATVAVVSGEDERRERARARGHEEIEGRDDRQLSQQEKASRATYVIENTGSLEGLATKVADLADRLKSS